MNTISLQYTAHSNTPITLPSSKSLTNRALVIAAMAGAGEVRYSGGCDDTEAVERALASDDEEIDIGAAGTAMRFLTAYFASREGRNVCLTGSERMQNRPIGILAEALNALGAAIAYAGRPGYPPLYIRGRKLRGGVIDINAGVSSQFISALLMAAPLCDEGLTLRFTGEPASRPYIEMTLKVMESFGVQSTFDGRVASVEPQRYKPCVYEVEGDWSAASYWYEIALLLPGADAVNVGRLNRDSLQGDSRVADIFARLGVSTEYSDGTIKIRRTAAPPEFLSQDFADCPDLAQTLVASCCLAGTAFDFTGLRSLRIKETDRISALQNECAKLGCEIRNDGDDRLFWDGRRSAQVPASAVPEIETYDDHRMALAFAPAALRFCSVIIRDPKVASKSYPGYWDDLRKIGFETNFLA